MHTCKYARNAHFRAQSYKKFLNYTNLFVFFNKNDTLYVNLSHIVIRFESKSVHFVIALGIGRATVLCNNAELVNPCKAGRSQGVDVSRYSKGL